MKRNGFTLIELLIVLAIIGIVAVSAKQQLATMGLQFCGFSC